MAHARSRSSRRGGRGRRASGRAPVPSAAEARLGALARELAALAGPPPAAGALARALELLASAYAPGGALPGALAAGWLASRGDKTAALALSWAREQVRLGLEEILARSARDGHARLQAPPDVLAWLVLAACEALAHEPPQAVRDRVGALRALVGLAP